MYMDGRLNLAFEEPSAILEHEIGYDPTNGLYK